jgi:hypothetical protein
LANRVVFPAGETWTMVVPVPWTLALSLKLLTKVSPAVSRPAEVGTTATPYGFTSPRAGTVEAISVPGCNWLRKDETGLALAAAGALEAEVVELDAQAVTVRPRPSAMDRNTADGADLTVLPYLEGRALRSP